jgi:TfoX/Sxy family transcriptional regulator of competence genes
MSGRDARFTAAWEKYWTDPDTVWSVERVMRDAFELGYEAGLDMGEEDEDNKRCVEVDRQVEEGDS